jgi:hypothetical protein
MRRIQVYAGNFGLSNGLFRSGNQVGLPSPKVKKVKKSSPFLPQILP